MQKIEHLGIAVKNLEEAEETYSKIFNTHVYKREEVESEGVKTSFLRLGPNKIELLESTREEGPIARFLEKKGEGLHHVAFAVTDIQSEVKRLKAEGFRLLNEEPKRGADNKLVVFLHPKDGHGLLIELCQERLEEE